MVGWDSFGAPRIIPARAGFTCAPPWRRRDWTDHPRSRGVYELAYDPATRTLGSSPLARGLPPDGGGQSPDRRIIPARAGFTVRGMGPCAAGRDHPRSRGVYATRLTRVWVTRGSSPLARGLRTPRTPGSEWSGIIPARAGFTAPGAQCSPAGEDHPRSRGVYPSLTSPHGASTGSSPLARGLLGQPSPRGDDRGIIPARAGFTRRRWR